MLREPVIEESRYAIPDNTHVDGAQLIEDFKNTHVLRVNQEITPILNAILSHKRLSNDDKTLLYENVINHVDIYFYSNKTVLIKIIDLLISGNIIKLLKTVRDNVEKAEKLSDIPKNLRVDKPENLKNATVNVKQVYFLRYQAQIIRYIDYVMSVFQVSV